MKTRVFHLIILDNKKAEIRLVHVFLEATRMTSVLRTPVMLRTLLFRAVALHTRVLAGL